jgi:hypothetical protein
MWIQNLLLSKLTNIRYNTPRTFFSYFIVVHNIERCVKQFIYLNGNYFMLCTQFFMIKHFLKFDKVQCRLYVNGVIIVDTKYI